MLAFLKRNFRWIAGGFLLTYFSTFGQTYFISASVAEWQSAFALSHGEFGRLFPVPRCLLPSGQHRHVGNVEAVEAATVD